MRVCNKIIQDVLIAFVMATSVTALYSKIQLNWLHLSLFNIPLLFIVLFIFSFFIASDVRRSFQKVLFFDKREDPLPIWQVGIGMIFYFSQVGFVEVFMRNWMHPSLGGMPLYLVISFLNAFLLTVIYQEIFYVEKKQMVQSVHSKNKPK